MSSHKGLWVAGCALAALVLAVALSLALLLPSTRHCPTETHPVSTLVGARVQVVCIRNLTPGFAGGFSFPYSMETDKRVSLRLTIGLLGLAFAALITLAAKWASGKGHVTPYSLPEEFRTAKDSDPRQRGVSRRP
jgi:hypothetical protein